MSLVETHTYDAFADGVTALLADDGIDAISGTPVYKTAAAVHGARGLQINNNAASVGYNCTSSGQASFYWPGYTIGTGSCVLWSLRNAGTLRFRMRLNPTTGKYEITDGSNTLVYTSTQSLNALTAGRCDIRWVYNSGADTAVVTVRFYFGANIEGTTPDETFTSGSMATSGVLSRFYFGTTIAAGWVINVDSLRLYDDTATWPTPFAGVVTPPTYVYSMSGDCRDTTASVVAKMSGTTSVKLNYSTSSVMASPSSTIVFAPDADGYIRFDLTGLTADTKYYYQLTDTVSGVTTPFGTINSFRTRPAAAGTGTVKIAAVSCILTNQATTLGGVPALDHATTWDPHYMAHLGDAYYNAVESDTLPSQHQGRWETQVSAVPKWKLALSKMAMEYTNSDHELNPDNADSNTTHALSFNEFARQRIPGIPYVVTGTNPVSKHRSWVDSKIRFIMIDVKNTVRSPGLNSDGPGKTMLGSAQLAWLLSELSQPELLKVIFCDVPWSRAALVSSSGQDKWWSYANERQIIADYITSHNINVDFVHGDAHRLGVDQTHNAWGGFPVSSCAPLANTAGGSQTDGYWDQLWPTTADGTPLVSVYMRLTYSWSGSSVTRVASGWDAINNVEKVSMTTTWSAAAPPTTHYFIKGPGGSAVAVNPFRKSSGGSAVAISAVTVAP